MPINPRKQPGKSFFCVTFRNPARAGKLVTASLQTDDEKVARGITDDIERLCSDTKVLQDADSPKLFAFHPRAVEIVTGKPLQNRIVPHLKSSEVGTLAGRLIDVMGAHDKAEVITEVLNTFETTRVREVTEQAAKSDANEMALKQRINVLVAELERRARKENEHAREPLSKAFERFKVEYPQGRKRQTVKEALRWTEDFIKSTDERGVMKIGEVRAEHCDKWLAAMDAVSPITRQHRKTYLSAFFTWAVRAFDLAEHPVRKSMPVTGASKTPEKIDHLKLEEIQALFKATEKNLYWLAWTSFAILAGPRWGEQVSLPIDAVNLEDSYITIRASKTGRQRRVPIEQTTLLPILKKFVSLRQKQTRSGKSVAEASQWLFPTTLPPHPYMERTISILGQWSSARSWHGAWELVAPPREKQKRIWSYGPKEWRHTFGTALGQGGFTGVEIARLMGNSPTVADRHYIAVSEAGRRWPFKW
jgi:integrase